MCPYMEDTKANCKTGLTSGAEDGETNSRMTEKQRPEGQNARCPANSRHQSPRTIKIVLYVPVAPEPQLNTVNSKNLRK